MIYILCGIVALLCVVQHFERKDLYDRIMSTSLSEYKSKEKSKTFSSAHERAIKKWRGKVGE